MTDVAPSDYRHKLHPQTCAEDDFWGQVSRTVRGQAVDQSQIDLIVEAIEAALKLTSADTLLDIACGNGALAAQFAHHAGAYVGVDFSEYLIQIAERYFCSSPKTRYVCLDAASFVLQEPEPERFDKALCYGAFPYFSSSDADLVLDGLRHRFPNLRILFIGNLPDRDLAAKFFTPDVDFASTLDDPGSAIGIWRSAAAFCQLASRHGWQAEIRRMPPSFYAAHYRYDAVLTRRI